MRGEMEAALAAHERALVLTLVRRGTSRPESTAARGWCSLHAAQLPCRKLLAWLDENEPRAGRDHFLRAYRAGALAMIGCFDESRAILAEERAQLAERGGGILLAYITAFESVRLELWAGDPAAAAEFASSRASRCIEELGDQDHLAESAGMICAGALRA